MKLVKITKGFRRVFNDNNYGSIASDIQLELEIDIDVSEDNKEKSSDQIKAANAKLAKMARILTNKDIKEYIALKAESKAI